MKDSKNKITGNDAEQLFMGGSIVVFKCEPTNSYPLTFVSPNVKDILGFSVEYFLNNDFPWAERIHHDDKEEVAGKFHQIMKDGGSAINEYRFKRKNGQQIWLRDEITLHYDEAGNPISILGTSFEITERKLAEIERQKDSEQELRKRLAYQNALSQCSNHLVQSSDNNVFNNVLKILVDVSETDRAYIFTNSFDKEDTLLVSQDYEATAKGVEPQIDNPELQNIPYQNFPMFYKNLSDNKVVNSKTEDLPNLERELMEAQGIKSVILLPIFIKEDWFGFMGFDSTREVKEWEEYEIIVLKTAVEIMGAFLKRQSMEESLVQQKNFTQQVLDNLPSILVIVDKRMNILQWNKNGERLTGYSKNELQNKTAFDLIVEEDHPHLKQAFKSILTNKTAGQELHLKHKRGKVSPYFWRGSIIEMNGEEVFLNIGLNITEQKKMEKAIVEQKQLADAIINSLPGTFFMLNEELNYVRVNRNFVNEIGYSEKELKSLNPFSFANEADKVRISNNIEEIYTHGESSIEVSPKTKTGEVKHRHVKSVLFELENHKFIIGTGNDISEIKKREKLLQISVQEKNVLLQEIHHRVKNNLAVISGLLELQAYEYDDPNLKRLIKESQLRIQTMAMIHEKLYQSQNLSRISVLEYIDDLISQIKNGISYGNAEVEVVTHIEEIELNINQAIPFALSLNEILSNALEHAFLGLEKGKIEVHLEEKGGVIYSTISDNGIGFPDADKPEKSKSLGMTLVRALMSQIDANWSVDGSNGVTYSISFMKDTTKGSSSALE